MSDGNSNEELNLLLLCASGLMEVPLMR